MTNKTSISDLINNNKAETILIVLGSIFYISTCVDDCFFDETRVTNLFKY